MFSVYLPLFTYTWVVSEMNVGIYTIYWDMNQQLNIVSDSILIHVWYISLHFPYLYAIHGSVNIPFVPWTLWDSIRFNKSPACRKVTHQQDFSPKTRLSKPLGCPPRPGCNRHKWKFRLRFPILEMVHVILGGDERIRILGPRGVVPR